MNGKKGNFPHFPHPAGGPAWWYRVRLRGKSLVYAGFSEDLAGELGFEPRQTESESVVLPLHHSPRITQDINSLAGCLDISVQRVRLPNRRPRECDLLPAWSRAWQALMAGSA